MVSVKILKSSHFDNVDVATSTLSKCEDFKIFTDTIFMVLFYGELVVFIGLSSYSYRKN